MIRSATRLTLLAILLSTAIFVAAFFTSDKTRYHNNFLRIFPPHAADIGNSVAFNHPITLAGITDESVYVRTGNRLIELSFDLLDTCSVDTESIAGHEISVDKTHFYLQNGKELKQGSNFTWQVDTIFQDLPAFTAVQPISKDLFALRIIDLQKRKNLFVLSSMPGSTKDILTTQVDGILCTDGYFGYSKTDHLLIYTYRYRNEFICMDTSLNVVFTGKTIDTTSFARISVAETNGQLTMSKPPFIVNKGIYVEGKHLFVNSNLVASNQSQEDVEDSSMIDVYNFADGSYLYSFYISDLGGRKMNAFIVQGDAFFAEFTRHIVRYDLALKYLED